MKNFCLSEILIYSAKERKAKRVAFHPSLTVILGKNDTGKSVLIKSIYHTFGANVKFDSTWDKAATCSLVRFSVDEKRYCILRWGKIFGLFDNEDKLVGSYESVTKDLGPVLANLFDFKMIWNDRQSETSVLPPAYLLLPYYVDQDKSWSDNWDSFEQLQQFGNWRNALIEYHTGLKPNEYYVAKTEHDKLKEISQEKGKEISIMKTLLERADKSISTIDFNTNIDSFKKEVEALIILSTELQKNQLQYKSSLTQLYSHKINLENQQKVVSSVLKEIKKDLNFATDVLDEKVECPTCGAHYSNSFNERFAIAEDEHKCYELSKNIYEEDIKITSKIKIERDKLKEINAEITEIQKSLLVKNEQIMLRDLIENEGRKQMQNIFSNRIEEMATEYYEILQNLSDLDTKIKRYTNKERRDEIIDFYKRLMRKYLIQLDVNFSESDYDRIDCKVSGLGSAKPRKLLAYYYSILNVIKKYGSSTFFPIIIDEPDQQGQDDLNMPNMLNFIIENKPQNAQLILGLQDTVGIDFEGSIVDISNKFSVLTIEDFESVQIDITPFINKVMSINNDLFSNL